MKTSNKKEFQKPASILKNSWLLAIVAASVILGIGIGVIFSTTATSDPENVNSRAFIDSAAPDSQLCVQYGASAIVTDARIYMTLNPFNVYVTQPRMQPGCVLRHSDWAILQQKNLVSNEQVRECKNRLNTFGFTGTLEGSPNINCIYQNEAAQNLFLNKADAQNAPTESSNF